jgi:hypothetical protein
MVWTDRREARAPLGLERAPFSKFAALASLAYAQAYAVSKRTQPVHNHNIEPRRVNRESSVNNPSTLGQ